MFNSPLAWCPVILAYVALDEPNRECAAAHLCSTGECPLRGLFVPRTVEEPDRLESTAAARPESKA